MSALRLLTNDLVYAESPRWHNDCLWISDVHDYTVKTIDSSGQVTPIVEVPGRPSGLGFTQDGRAAVVSSLERKIYWIENRMLVEAFDLDDVATGPLGDMVIDGQGRLWVDDVGYDRSSDADPKLGQIILAEHARGGRVVADGLAFPNGCAVSHSGTTYVIAETDARQVSQFSISGRGELSRRRTLAQLDEMPDGLCLDADGGMWVAMLTSGTFVRLDRRGEIDRRVRVPSASGTACALGGENRRTLFLCSATVSRERLSLRLPCSRIDTLVVDTPGSGQP